MAIFFKKNADFSTMRKAKTPIVMRIDDLLAAQNKGRKDLIIAIGANRGVLTNWDKRETVPAADIALKIADYLGVSLRWLITGKDEQGLTLEERNLLVKYRSLDDRDRYEVNALLDAKLEGDVKRELSS
jgi:transcriptional regulator with XRE-family HTH domain